MRYTVILLSFLACPMYAQSPDLVAHRLIGNSKIALIQENLGKDYENILADATRFVEDRSHVSVAFAESLKKSGVTDVRTDGYGNVIGYWKGTGNGRAVAVAVRLPSASADINSAKPREENTRLFAPGIAGSYSLAVMLSWIRALKSAGVGTAGDVFFLATPNDDAEGRLLMDKTYRDRIQSFIALEAIKPGDIVNESPETPNEPAARTHVSLNLVQLATAVIKEFGMEPVYRTGTSSAGVPMRLGIPAIALGYGMSGGEPYTAQEWIDTGRESTPRAATVGLTVLLSAAGIK